MIDTLYLANMIENNLNSNTLGLNFLIFADEGDLRNTVREPRKTTKYTHGLLEVTSSSLIPIKSITFQTFTTQLMILVDLDSCKSKFNATEREQSTNLLDVKAVLNDFIKANNGVTTPITIDSKTYNLTMALSMLTDGQKMSLGEISEGLPLYLTINFTFFENGVNANDCHLYINHEDIYYTRLVISRVKTTDNNNMANNNGAKVLSLMGGKSFDAVVPATTSAMGVKIMQDILGNELNKAYCIRVETPLASENYICILGNDSANLDTGANVGFNIAFAEGIEKLLDYGADWQVSTVSGATTTKTTIGNATIFWGDGTSTYLKQNATTTHTYTDGKNTHIVRIYGGV